MGMPRYWTDARILSAMQNWADKHGKPPTSGNWAYSTPDHPQATQVTNWFGSWNQGIEAAGLTPRPAKRKGVRW